MKVTDLNTNQLNQLKEQYFIFNNSHNISWEDILTAHEISNEVIFEFYNGITFVEDDFFN